MKRSDLLMNNTIKHVSYTTTNTYETLNKLTGKTKNIWLVFHGIGYLSKFFLRYFDELNTDENYIIAPQAPSKYYLKNTYKHVGASWLTKENTDMETNNIYNYLNAVLAQEKLPEQCNLIILGFSQGVSIALRYSAFSQIPCSKLVLYAGGIPNELKKHHFDHLKNTKVISVIGDKDEYLSPERLREERHKLISLFGQNIHYINFNGGHEVRKDIINQI